MTLACLLPMLRNLNLCSSCLYQVGVLQALALAPGARVVGQGRHLLLLEVHDAELLLVHLLLQLLGDGVDVDVEVPTKELANVRVLNVAADLLGLVTAGAVDVDVERRVAVGAPADVGAEANHGGEGLDRDLRVVDESLELLRVGIVDAEAGDDELLVDPLLELLLVKGLAAGGGDLLQELFGEQLGGGGGLCEGLGVPVVDGEVSGLLC